MSEINLEQKLHDEFHPAYEEFLSLASMLADESKMMMEHGDIERLIYIKGTEVLRMMYQGHLN